jgi:hypothetical protein
MEARRVIICCAPEDGGASLSASTGLEASGFECRPSGIGDGSLKPGDFQWADVMVVLLSVAADRSDRVLRDVEEAVSCGLRIVPVRLDGTPPNRALRYYLGPFQWVEPDRGGDYLESLVMALNDEGIASVGRGGTRKTILARAGAAVVIAAVVIAVTLSGFFGNGGDRAAEPAAVEATGATDSFDILIIGPENAVQVPDYLDDMGYSVDSLEELPAAAELLRYDILLFCLQGDPETALVLYDYLCSGGSVILTGGQPYFMGMPEWLGMGTYSNYWGGDFPITAAADSLLGDHRVRRGDIFVYYTEFMDGGAVLKNPTTAEVDACFSGEDSLAAVIRNTVGAGRLAWFSFIPAPFANSLGNEYSTGLYESYLDTLYAWLDRDGPEGTE